MQSYENVQIRYLRPGPEELRQVIGGGKAWHMERPSEPSPDARDQTKPGIRQIHSADLQAWIAARIKVIKRRPLQERIAATLEK